MSSNYSLKQFQAMSLDEWFELDKVDIEYFLKITNRPSAFRALEYCGYSLDEIKLSTYIAFILSNWEV